MPVASSVRRNSPHDPIALGGGGVDRHEIVVVEVDAVRAQVGQLPDRVAGVQRRTDEVAEGIAAAIADRPEAEGELVRGRGLQCHRRGAVRLSSPLRNEGSIAAMSARYDTVSAVGNAGGSFCVTRPVAAHSVPRCSVTTKSTELSA